MRWRTRQILIAVILLAWPFYSFSAEKLKIGLLAPPQEPEAVGIEQGVRLAIENANAMAGAKGELVVRGRPGQWGTDGDEAVGLALDESVSAMIASPDGSVSHQVMQVAGRTRVPVVSLCTDSSVSGTGIPWVLRIVPRSDSEAGILLSEVKAKSWAALVPNGRAGREAAKDLWTAARNSECNLQEPLRLPLQQKEWEATVRKLMASKSEGILLWIDPGSAGEIAKQLRKLGYQGRLGGLSRLNSSLFLEQAGAAAEGFMVCGIGQNKPTYLTEKYQQQFGKPPDFTVRMAYDAGMLLVQLLRENMDQPVYRAFPLKKEFGGGTAPLKFDKDGNRQFELKLLVCRNGHFVSAK